MNTYRVEITEQKQRITFIDAEDEEEAKILAEDYVGENLMDEISEDWEITDVQEVTEE